jgi:hypothetical protein
MQEHITITKRRMSIDPDADMTKMLQLQKIVRNTYV